MNGFECHAARIESSLCTIPILVVVARYFRVWNEERRPHIAAVARDRFARMMQVSAFGIARIGEQKELSHRR
jgi:hypothetical protein